MEKQCPNCDAVFVENRDEFFMCADCGWFKFVDGSWRSVTEPVAVVVPEPVPPPEPTPPEPTPPEPTPPEPTPPEPDNVTEYFGGLVTVTHVKDESENEDE